MQRKTIGILIDWTSNQYQLNLLYGFSNKAKELDINLICFEGGIIKANSIFETARNKIFDFVTKERLDGLITVSTSIGVIADKTSIVEFINKFTHIPLVNIGLEIKNINSIIIDNKKDLKI